MWSKRAEETGGHRREAKMLQVQRERAQEVGMSANERKEKGGDSSVTKDVGESEGAQWSKGIAPMKSNNVYRGVDDTQRSSHLCRM